MYCVQVPVPVIFMFILSPCVVGVTNITILQKKKLGFKEVKYISQVYVV